MSGTKVTLPLSGERVELELPAGWQVAGIVEPEPVEATPDIGAALAAALSAPHGRGPLTTADLAGKRVVVAVDDISRPTPTARFVPLLLGHLERLGLERGRTTIVFATGVHRPMTAAEAAVKLGTETAASWAWECHDAGSEELLTDCGLTSRGTPVRLNRRLAEADLIVCAGAIEPHLLLGFGGGAKMIIPGLAGRETIQANHMQGVGPESYNYAGVTESPMRLDLEEGVGLLGRPLFVVNAVLNQRLEVARFVCGDPVAAHRAGAALVGSICGREAPEGCDIAIVSSSPMDADLRQGMKCIGNIERSVRDNGLVIALLACSHGIGDVAMPPKAPRHRILRFVLRLLGPGRVLWFIDRVKKGAGVEERFMAHFSMQVVRRLELFVFSPGLPADTGRRIGLFRQFDSIGAMLSAAARYAPKNARVVVFPHAGMTFPAASASAQPEIRA